MIIRAFYALVFLLAATTSVRAQTTGTTAVADKSTSMQTAKEDLSGLKTDDLITEGVGWLKRGIRLQRSADLFEEAVRRQPQNLSYQTYLASATAARAFLLAQYVQDRTLFPTMQEFYTLAHHGWEQAQQTKNSPLFNIPEPPKLASPRIIDGGEILQKPDQAIKEEIGRLSESALNALIVANKLSAEPRNNQNTKEYVNALDLQGWSAMLLSIAQYQSTKSKMGDKNVSQTAIELMESALNRAIDSDSSVRQKIIAGDAFVLAKKYPLQKFYRKDTKVDAILKKGIQLLMDTAPKTKNKGATWYWIADSQCRFLPAQDVEESLKRALSYDSANPLYNHIYAGYLAHTLDFSGTAKSDTSNSDKLNEEITSHFRMGLSVPSGIVTNPYKISAPYILRWTFANYDGGSLAKEAYDGMTIYLLIAQQSAEKSGNYETMVTTLRDMAKYGNQLFRSSGNGDLSDAQRYSLAASAMSEFMTVGQMLFEAMRATKNKNLATDLEYTWAFLRESRRQPILRILQEGFGS